MDIDESMYKLISVVLLCTTIVTSALAINYNYRLIALEEDYHKVIEELDDFTVQVNILIDYGDGEIEWFNETRIQVGANLLVATGLVCDIKFQTSNIGSFVTSINGVVQDTTHFWIWSLYDNNWEMGPVGADQHILHNGDVVRWTYTSFE